MEREKAPSIDRTADTFAVILSDAVGDAGLDEKTSEYFKLCSTISARIYIIDACDDYTEDIEKNSTIQLHTVMNFLIQLYLSQ